MVSHGFTSFLNNFVMLLFFFYIYIDYRLTKTAKLTYDVTSQNAIFTYWLNYKTTLFQYLFNGLSRFTPSLRPIEMMTRCKSVSV